MTVFNRDNWERPPKVSSYSSEPMAYQIYVVNHEFGHVLGQGHRACSGTGSLVPVMVQQTKGIAQCKQNPWPLPNEVDSVNIRIY